LRIFSFGGYGLALAALVLVVFGAHDSYPLFSFFFGDFKKKSIHVFYSSGPFFSL